MDTRNLRVFLHLSQSLHFGRTSDALNLSPSAVSRVIKQLEQQLDCLLFVRDNRTVNLTEQGAQLQTYARDSLQQWETLQDQIKSSGNTLHGSISIYCSVTASYSLLYTALDRFRQRHPNIELVIHTGDPALAIERCQSDQEDISVAAMPAKLPPALRFHSLTTSPLVSIAPLKKQFEEPHSHQEWGRCPLILPETGLTRKRANQWFSRHNIQPNIHAQVNGHEAVVSMVALGMGVGIVPQIVLDHSPLADKVRPLSNQLELEPYNVGVCVKQKRIEQDPVIKAFWEALISRSTAD